MTQFRETLPTTGPPSNHQAIVSHITPFGARVVWEIITTPQPVKATRPTGPNTTMSDYYMSGGMTTYVHMLINQRTLPFHKSYSMCPQRDDGWCELSTVMKVWSGLLQTAQYDYSCFGDYPAVPFGKLQSNPTARTWTLTQSRDSYQRRAHEWDDESKARRG